KRKRLRIDTLPGSLENAISEFKKSRLMKRVLGDHIFEKLIDNKIVEWDQYRIAVTGYEIDNYFPVL
ncbi:MAG: glutamine synthetase, partial [Candidatus Zixiibacteriota bacterium]